MMHATGSGPKVGHSLAPKEERTKLADVIHLPVCRTARGIDDPATFPVELAEVLIQSFCPASGVVLDPFCGSGVTPVAAKRLDRAYYGFDAVPDHCPLVRQRLAGEVGTEPPQQAG